MGLYFLPGSFQARDNVAQFIDWLKGIGVAESILFEASDLVDHKNEKNVLYRYIHIDLPLFIIYPPPLNVPFTHANCRRISAGSLMELGRKQYGVNPPTVTEKIIVVLI